MKKPIGYKFSSPEKERLETWFTLASNLRAVDEAIDRLLSLLESTSGREQVGENLDLVVPFFVYAVTMYVRCFAPGRRIRLSINSIPRLTATDLQTHENIRALRNRHFAHPVSGDHEGTEILLVVTEDRKKNLGFHRSFVTLASEAPPELRRFKRLNKKVMAHVDRQSENLADAFAQKFFGKGAKWSDCQYEHA